MMSTEQAEADREAYEAREADPTYIDLMPIAYAEGAAYYYNEERGYRDNWDNHAVSWSELSWADFHPEEFIAELEAPYLIITGENAWSRSGAEQLYENTTSEKEFYVIEGAGHFDMYDLKPYVTQALDYALSAAVEKSIPRKNGGTIIFLCPGQNRRLCPGRSHPRRPCPVRRLRGCQCDFRTS